jgi:ribose transport system substrate-binding protein
MKRLWIVLTILAVASVLLVAACGSGGETTTTGAVTTQAPTTAAPTTAAPTTASSGSDTTATASTGKKPIIALSLPALDNPLMLGFKDAFTKAFGDKYDVQVASADGNVNTQATQIENYTALKPALMFILETEATSLLPKLQDARNAGIKVLVGGGDPGEGGADAVMRMDQFLGGEYAAYMAKNWVDKTFPDAPDGSIETAVLQSTLTQESVNRTNGLLMISEPYLKNQDGAYIDASGAPISDATGNYLAGKSEADRVANPVYSPKVKIVQKVEAQMMQDGQTAMQNILTTNPNVNLVLAYASDGGMGASNAILDEYAKGSSSVIKDLAKMAVFGVGMVGAEGQAVADSATNKSVLRGAVSFGGLDLPQKTTDLAAKILNGEQFPAITWDELALGQVVDGQLQVKPVANSGVISGTP